ncbi:MAG: hypothetical protein Q4C70_15015 [Planctomycetia bacterium]|nr:hypothetical protein [Planctomycetia bacterium]
MLDGKSVPQEEYVLSENYTFEEENEGTLQKKNRFTEIETEINTQVGDWVWLLSEAGNAVMGDLQKRGLKDELKKTEFLRKSGISPEKTRLVLEQLRLRERATEKFGDMAENMIFTPVGMEQSTDRWIAAYKASRFPEGLPVADVCCGIGGDLTAFALKHPVLGVDYDLRTALATSFNIERFSEISGHTESGNQNSFLGNALFKVQLSNNLNSHEQIILVSEKKNNNILSCEKEWKIRTVTALETESETRKVACITAEEFLKTSNLEKYPCIHLDPDRRSEGVRTTKMSYFEPSQEVVEDLISGRKVAAVKLAPGTEVPPEWLKNATELEWIGRNRECRQLLVWFFSNQRPDPEKQVRATIIDAHSESISISICGKQHRKIETAEKPGKYVFDIDSTFLAAGLEGELASQFGLKRLGEGSVYLTGDEPISGCAALSCFEILKVLPLDRKQIVKEIRERNWKNLEIKKRGNVPEPEVVRKWIKLVSKGESGTLILAQISPKNVAIIAKRVF